MAKTKANTSTITLADGREVFQSYGVTVAAFIPADVLRPNPDTGEHEIGFNARKYLYDHNITGGYVRTDARFSVTTSRHMNDYAGKDAPAIPHAQLLELTAPVLSKQ